MNKGEAYFLALNRKTALLENAQQPLLRTLSSMAFLEKTYQE